MNHWVPLIPLQQLSALPIFITYLLLFFCTRAGPGQIHGQNQFASCFCGKKNKVLLEHSHAQWFLLSIPAFTSHQQRWIVVTEIVWPKCLKYFLSGLSQKIFTHAHSPVHVRACLLGRVLPSAAPCAEAHQAPLSMGLSRQEYRSGWTCPSPGDLSHPETKPRSVALQADSLLSEPSLSPICICWRNQTLSYKIPTFWI